MNPAILAVVCTINNDREHTLEFVSRYVEIPCCRLILFLDDPAHLSYFDGDFGESLTVTQCTEDYWLQEIGHPPRNMPEKQHTNIRKGAELARNLGIEWCVSVDSDELILNLANLVPVLDEFGTDYDLLRLLPAELIHDEESAFNMRPFYGRYFKYCLKSDELQARIKKLNRSLRGRLRSLKRLTRRLFFGHTNGKTIFSLSAPITTYKQHKQFSDQRELREIVLPTGYLVLHYDAMNYATWLAKWKRRINGHTRATAIHIKRKRQTDRIARSFGLFEKFRTKRLFRKLYVFKPGDISQLKSVGIVFEVDC